MKYHMGKVYITDVDRAQKSPSGVEDMIVSNANLDGKSVRQDMPQDPGQAGKAQKITIGKLLHGLNFAFSLETGSKEDRATPLAAQCEIGNVYLVRADWNQQFLNEAALFPNGTFKDQIDAASRAYLALIALANKGKRKVASAAEVFT
jgi:predicted phage terminase large subunit-like protein